MNPKRTWNPHDQPEFVYQDVPQLSMDPADTGFVFVHLQVDRTRLHELGLMVKRRLALAARELAYIEESAESTGDDRLMLMYWRGSITTTLLLKREIETLEERVIGRENEIANGKDCTRCSHPREAHSNGCGSCNSGSCRCKRYTTYVRPAYLP